MSGHVLVVDDDRDLRETVADVLDGAGYRVETAENGQLALDLLDTTSDLPDVILLDMMMPIMDGWAFGAAKLHHPRLASIPVIVFSAHADIADAVSAVRAVGSLAKPLRAKSLLEAIARQVPA